MRTDEIKEEIDKLGLSEKLMLVEDIWDSIASENADLPMPVWQKIELEKRYTEFKNGKMKLHDWEDVHSELRKK